MTASPYLRAVKMCCFDERMKTTYFVNVRSSPPSMKFEQSPSPEKPSFEKQCKELFDEKFKLAQRIVLERDTLTQEQLLQLNTAEEQLTLERIPFLAASATDADLHTLVKFLKQEDQRNDWLREQRIGDVKGSYDTFKSIRIFNEETTDDEYLELARSYRESGRKKQNPS